MCSPSKQVVAQALKTCNVRKWSEVAQSCLTLCDPMDCSLLGSSVHGIFQARVLEWVAISFSNVRKVIWIITFWFRIYFQKVYWMSSTFSYSNTKSDLCTWDPNVFMEISMSRNWGISPKALKKNCLVYYQWLRSREANLLPDTLFDLATEWLTPNWRLEAKAACLIPKIS